MNDNLVLYENCIARLEASLACAKTFKDIEGLLIDFISMDEKPLVYLYLHQFTLIRKLVILICQTSDLNTRLFQLSLLSVGLKTDGEHARVLPDFILELYWNGFGSMAPVLLETGRHYLIKSLLDTDNFNPKLYDNISDNIMRKQHFDVALAYCLQQMPSFVFKQKSKVALYAYLMEGHDNTAEFNDAWWRVVHEKVLYYQVFERFMSLYFDLATNLYIDSPEKILRVSRALSGLIKKYDSTQSDSMNGLSLIDREKRIIYSYILKIDFESTFNPFIIITMLKDCPESDIDIFLRLITTAGAFTDVFRQVYFSFKKGGNIADEFYKPEYIAKLSKALNRLNPKAIPHLTLVPPSLLYTYINAHSLLMLLVLVSRNLSDSTIIPHQKAWIRLSFALVEQVLVKAKGALFEMALTDLIDTYDIHSFLPETHQQPFLDLLQQTKQDWSLNDDRIQYLCTTLSTPEKLNVSKKYKKSMGAHATVQTEQAALFDHLGDVSKMSSELVESDTALLSNLPHQVLVSKASSDEDLFDHEGQVDAPLMSLASAVPVDLFYKQLKLPLKKIRALLSRMQRLELPSIWPGLVEEVGAGVALIHQDESTKAEKDEGLEETIFYAAMDRSEQLLLEKTWNMGLAFFCWDIQCAQQSYLSSCTDDEIAQINGVVKEVLQSLSSCYFKNISLHLHKKIMSPLAEIALYLRGKGHDLFLKGSFVFPEKIRDLDLFIIPRAENIVAHAPYKMMQDLAAHFSSRLVPGRIFQNTDIWSQQVLIQLDEISTIEVDFVFSLRLLSAEQKLAMTLTSVLSTMSVLWNINGSACMVPLAARANCGNKLVLRPITELSTDAHWLKIAGYLVKQQIKLGQDVCLSPELVQFSVSYLDPITRYISRPQANERLVILNKKMIAEVLGYLFSRFTTRTHLTVMYIVDKQLLQGLFSLSAIVSEGCFSYFNSHFIPKEGEFQPTLLSPVFLAMFLLGGIIDQSQASTATFFSSLQQSLVFCNEPLEKMLLKTIIILKKLPHSTMGFYVDYKSQDSLGKGLTFEDCAAQMVLKSWHVKTSPQINASTRSISIATPEAGTKAPPNLPGRTSQFFRPAPQEEALPASTRIAPN
jgi:hypothetical protein